MSPVPPRRLFALDHNFPQPILAALADALPMVDLVPISDIDPTFADLDDWELMLQLHLHERRWDGLITNDDTMLSLAKEMTVLAQTRLTLVVAQGQGHNPIRAVGVLLCHLPFICHQTQRDVGQVWRIKVAQKEHDPVTDYLEKIAERAKTTREQLVAANKLPADRLRRREASRQLASS